eukprot:5820539-Pleurochrysis_carterae.AAC.1
MQWASAMGSCDGLLRWAPAMVTLWHVPYTVPAPSWQCCTCESRRHCSDSEGMLIGACGRR